MATKEQCSAMVYPRESYGAFHAYRCTKAAKVLRDGKWYCGTHDPLAMKEKEAKRSAQFNAECDARQEQSRRDGLLRKLCANIPTEDLENYELVKKGSTQAHDRG